MRKTTWLVLFTMILSFSAYSQVAVLKMIGRDADKSKTGFGMFLNYSISVTETGNRMITLELLDGAFFPRKQSEEDRLVGYISIKAGFRNIFSYESKTGFFVEPQLGYCRVVRSGLDDSSTGNGLAAAFITGYNLEVGERGNSLCFGLKYEADIAGKDHTLQSLAFRIAYLFNLQRR